MQRKISKHISLLLLIILVGFPQISETIYTPSLPDIARHMAASSNAIQLTLSIYFLGFALGVFCWGRLSDLMGRRPSMLWGIFVYAIGSLGCYWSSSVEWLMVCRFIQAFGASAGSAVTQTILRESLDGAKRHAAFAQISAALAFTPAVGPLLGGWVDQALGFRAVFFTLVLMGVVIWLYAWVRLPETRLEATQNVSMLSVAARLMKDRRVWRFGLLIGAANGILFSYYAEAPFIYIDFFGMSAGTFGCLGIFVALSSIVGAMLSRRLLPAIQAERIITLGCGVSTTGALSLACLALYGIEATLIDLVLTVSCVFVILLGIGMALPNCLSMALVDYHDVLGTSGAMFGLGYYLLVSIITSGMSLIHNGSLLTMPLYFLVLVLSMLLVSLMRRSKEQQAAT
ncbi:multidrug effflux MFS transporter [Paenibacillus maysiensis]|uniref:multidrug effflux MFS transporter n=1 Tax=Paenibacillus maysiensis TaxID=1155954 RepID=UPI00046EE649|nr:multidrug effflux MFS transporter [Paenibacillus maysiensis]